MNLSPKCTLKALDEMDLASRFDAPITLHFFCTFKCNMEPGREVEKGQKTSRIVSWNLESVSINSWVLLSGSRVGLSVIQGSTKSMQHVYNVHAGVRAHHR